MPFAFFPKAFLTYASSVQVGAQSGIQECKHQFALDRWNCPESTLQLSTHNGLRSGKKAWIHNIYFSPNTWQRGFKSGNCQLCWSARCANTEFLRAAKALNLRSDLDAEGTQTWTDMPRCNHINKTLVAQHLHHINVYKHIYAQFMRL